MAKKDEVVEKEVEKETKKTKSVAGATGVRVSGPKEVSKPRN